MRVAIVNDLALAREVLRRLVLSVSGYTVAWTAADGAEAVDRAAHDRPDVILMDLVMPVMDGVEATRRIMAGSPCPILLVTSSVSGNFNKVYEAMGHGGLDAVNTPTLGPDGQVRDSEGLLARLARLGRSRRGFSMPPLGVPTPCAGRAHSTIAVPPVVALGASTGGPEALAQVLGVFPPNLPAAVVVVQHIGPEFIPSLAQWLQGAPGCRCGWLLRVMSSSRAKFGWQRGTITWSSVATTGWSTRPNQGTTLIAPPWTLFSPAWRPSGQPRAWPLC